MNEQTNILMEFTSIRLFFDINISVTSRDKYTRKDDGQR